MKKSRFAAVLAVAAITAATVLTGCGNSNKNETQAKGDSVQETGETADAGLAGTSLNLYTWDGMFPQEVLDGFEETTGVKINYSNFDYDEDMLAKLEETKGGDYDFVVADDYILEMIRAEGLAQDLDASRISNWEGINPVFQCQFYDPANAFTIPYGAGIPLIVYNPEATDVEIKGYADLWNPALEDNVALIANYRVINGITLKTMGESFNTNDTAKIQEAGDKLLELAPNVRVINDSNTQDFLLSGEVAAGFLYSSQVTAALQADENLVAVYPEEGLGFGIMAGFIPSDAPNADAAYAFINYIMQPENYAKCIEYIGYYCTNKAAEEYISEDMKKFIVLPEDASEGEIIQNVTQEAEDLHGEIWNNFKNACD